jgi:hypothetical protein
VAFRIVLTAAVVVGGVIETSLTPPRVVLDGPNDQLEVYNSAGTLVATLGGPNGNLEMGTAATGTINLLPADGQINMTNPAGFSQIVLDGQGQIIQITESQFGTYLQLNTSPAQVAWANKNINQQGLISLGGGANPNPPFLAIHGPWGGTGNTDSGSTIGLWPGKTPSNGNVRPKVIVVDDSALQNQDVWLSGAVLGCSLDGSTVNTWQTPGLGSGWASGPVAGSYQGLKFRKDTQDQLMLRGVIHTTSTSPAGTIFTLPAGYRPLNGQRPGVTANAGGTYSLHSLEIATTGVVTVDPAFTVSSADLYIYADVPLGNIP